MTGSSSPPRIVRLAGALLVLESVFWLLAGLLCFAWGVGLWNATLAAHPHDIGVIGLFVALPISVVAIVAGVAMVAISNLGLWSGVGAWRRSDGPSIAGVVLAALGAMLGLLAAFGALPAPVSGTARLICGLILVAVNLVIIGALVVGQRARDASLGPFAPDPQASPSVVWVPSLGYVSLPPGSSPPPPGWPAPPQPPPSAPAGPPPQAPAGP
ncbi:MAG: hypothetical protein ABSA40_08985 [Candidatus Dormibacteria bacterium]|jgi:hypothetical protein